MLPGPSWALCSSRCSSSRRTRRRSRGCTRPTPPSTRWARKRLDLSETTSEWAQRILVEQQPFFGPDRAAVRSYFFDWETIESLGCGAIINTPVVHEGVTVGSINFLTVDGAWDEASVATAMAITRDATPAVVQARAREFPELRP